MATYFISPYGSDSNNGLGPDPTAASNKPWLTPAKALGASGFASGDICYMAPGRYMLGATTTVAMTSATIETIFAGDQRNNQGFKDGLGNRLLGGDVLWSSWANDRGNDARGLLVLSGRDFLTFRNIGFAGSGGVIIDATAAVSTDIKFQDCHFGGHPGANNVFRVLTSFGVAANWVIERCAVYGSTGNRIELFLTRGAGADYDINFIIRNCYIQGIANTGVFVQSTGAGVNFGGGIQLINNLIYSGGNAFTINDASVSTSIPARLYGNQIYASLTCINANAAGQAIEDYNRLAGTFLRSNVTAGVHSVSQWNTLMSGHREFHSGRRTRFWFMPDQFDPHLGFGNDATYTSTEDIFALPRPNGTLVFGDEGTASAGAARTLTDSTKVWGVNNWNGYVLRIISGTGSGQVKQITSNTSAVITVDGNWVTNPSSDSVYVIYFGALVSSGKATAGAATTMTDGNAAWATDQWIGWTLEIRAGTGLGQTRTISTNSATVATVGSAWGTNPDSTSQYWMYRDASENAIPRSVGPAERPDTMFRVSTPIHSASGYSLRALGPATQDFEVPVGPTFTQIKVWARYDASYVGTKPQVKIVNGLEANVADATATMVAAADTWEQLTLSFTPDRAGVITVRLQSSSTAVGSAYFSDMAVSA